MADNPDRPKDDGKITAARARELLRYDSNSGRLFWKKSTPWTKAEAEAGRRRVDGYCDVSLDRKRYLVHRIAWLLTYGCFPQGELDHKNRDHGDNRLSNLREATRSQNKANRGKKRSSISQTKGVSWDTNRGKWSVFVAKDGKRRWVGRFAELGDASEAYAAAAIEMHGEFACYG